MADKAQEPAGSKKPLNLKLIGGIVFSVINFGVLGAGVFYTYKSTIGWTTPALTEKILVERAQKLKESNLEGLEAWPWLYKMEPLVVNLGGAPQRTIKLDISLELTDREGFEEIMSQETQVRVRDQLVRILGDKSFSQLESVQGKLGLKNEISDSVNTLLVQSSVKGVYFSEFSVQ